MERRNIKMNGKTQKKGFHMPHVFIILLVIMLFVVLPLVYDPQRII